MGHLDVTLLSVLPSTVVKSLTDPTLRRPNLGFPSRESFFKKVDVLGDPLNLLERASECVLLSTRVGRTAAKPVSTLPSSLYHSALTGYYNSRRSSARVEGLESVLRGYQSRLDSLVAQVGEEVARKEALQDQVRQLEAAILGQEEGRRSIVEEIEVLEEKVRQRPAPAAVNELRKQLIEAYSTVQTEREARRQLENTISELRHESMESTQRQNALMNEIRSLHIEVRERNETSALDSKAANMELYDPFAVNIREEKKRPQGFASFLGKENY
ncbi:hypothetical protein AGDE_12585 [Angomonas deanei]|nr:hypothetical protein AGDE_12585 [Angomonas deanei]|eukprot:EPY24149.1 hypothetical protein AGDE_12585 [Angomonas deanei]